MARLLLQIDASETDLLEPRPQYERPVVTLDLWTRLSRKLSQVPETRNSSKPCACPVLFPLRPAMMQLGLSIRKSETSNSDSKTDTAAHENVSLKVSCHTVATLLLMTGSDRMPM